MSNDAVKYFVNGWKKGVLTFNGKLTLGNMIGKNKNKLL